MKKLFLFIVLFISIQSINAQIVFVSRHAPYYSARHFPTRYYSGWGYTRRYYSPEEIKRIKESIIWSKAKIDEFIVDEENKTVYFKDKVFEYDHTQEIDNTIQQFKAIIYRNEKQETITYFDDRSHKKHKIFVTVVYENTKPEIIDLK